MVDVAIIGAGFAGLGAGLRLKQRRDNSFRIFERADQVGGTWRDNVYPGCACDIPSHLYALSSAPKPDWSRLYSSQPEILNYLKQLAVQQELSPHIHFHSEIIRLAFSANQGYWTLTDRHGQQTNARMVLAGLGPLNQPSLPTLPGLDQFAGHQVHSS